MGTTLNIGILASGDLDSSLIDFLSNALAEEIKARVIDVKTVPIPGECYNPLRDQYNSTLMLYRLLSDLKSVGGSGGACCLRLVLTPVDLYVEGLNFVFGEAIPKAGICIVSLARLGSGDLQMMRLIKEAIHEIGHLVGLGHCKKENCVMFFSNSLIDTDRKSKRFCDMCRKRFERCIKRFATDSR